MAAANLLQYALQLVASRALAPSAFGAFGALLGLGVVGSVPMLALQTVAARHVALRAADPAARAREVARLLAAAQRLALLLSAACLLVSPLAAAFLHVPVVAAALLAVSLGPLALAGTAQGVLQGRERFGALAQLFLAVSALRVAGGVAGLLVSPTVTGGMAGTAVGALLAALVARAVVAAERATGEHGEEPPGFPRELRQAVTGVLALLVLGSTDLLLARHLMPGATSGRYAAGALVARGCFWGPQFVAVLVVPRVSAGQQRVLRQALGVVAALGALEVAVALAAPPAALELAFGDGYGPLAGRVALFALAGALLAVLQLLLQTGIAAGGSSVGRWAWAAVAAEAGAALLLRPGLTGMVTLSVAVIAAAVAGSLLTGLRR
jgi:O-antigen/teichoic acid export membrane protein